MNLINEEWIPVRRKSGLREKIAPWQITDKYHEDPVIELDTPRPDFNGALYQFLIGLVQTTISPKKEKEWRKLHDNPPNPAELKKTFSEVEGAFNLDGDSPRFMQDSRLNNGSFTDVPINALLLETPGENTLKRNADLFIKRGQAGVLCYPCAASALFCLQNSAPAGGAGHRTSIRGGGPLTTLVLGENLWQTVWFNTLNKDDFYNTCGEPQKERLKDIFPWLASARTSEPKTGSITTPLDVHTAQIFWAMPRRIWLDLKNTESGTCSICGNKDEKLVKRYATKNYGVNYEGGFMHPLSPYYDKDGKLLPRHAKQGGVSYRHWLGLILADNADNKKQEPAAVVRVFLSERWDDEKPISLWAFGYEMDNMKAVCWHESKMPLLHLPEGIRTAFEDTVADMLRAADEVNGNLHSCIKDAWFKRRKDAKGNISFIGNSFWRETESDFYEKLKNLKSALENSGGETKVKKAWHKILCKRSLDVFDIYAASIPIEDGNAARIAKARNKLYKFNYKKTIVKLLNLK